MIQAIAVLEVAEGRRDDFLVEFRQLVPKVVEEAGCLEYVLMIDLPTSIGAQSGERVNAVTVVEKWESVEALEAHLIAPHMMAFRKAAADLVVDMTLHILEPAL